MANAAAGPAGPAAPGACGAQRGRPPDYQWPHPGNLNPHHGTFINSLLRSSSSFAARRGLCLTTPPAKTHTCPFLWCPIPQVLQCIAHDLPSLKPLVLHDGVRAALWEALWAAAPSLDAQVGARASTRRRWSCQAALGPSSTASV